jgi:hypothetical protein
MLVGLLDGSTVGATLGVAVGNRVGVKVGRRVGIFISSLTLGADVTGAMDGSALGASAG